MKHTKGSIAKGQIWLAADGCSNGCIVQRIDRSRGDAIVRCFTHLGWDEEVTDIDLFKLTYRYYRVK